MTSDYNYSFRLWLALLSFKPAQSFLFLRLTIQFETNKYAQVQKLNLLLTINRSYFIQHYIACMLRKGIKMI